jgi:hypothetical protein
LRYNTPRKFRNGSVAQWQSSCLLSNWLRVRISPESPLKGLIRLFCIGPFCFSCEGSMETLKKCSVCKKAKNIEEFSWRWKTLGIRQSACRECRRVQVKKWYSKHKEEHLENVKVRKYKFRQEVRQYVWDYLSAHPCSECGEADPIVLEFHHLRGKDKAVSELVGAGWSIQRVQAEIDKCIVLCANCHRRKTMTERGWFRGKK